LKLKCMATFTVPGIEPPGCALPPVAIAIAPATSTLHMVDMVAKS
jgi:hypothetical protein